MCSVSIAMLTFRITQPPSVKMTVVKDTDLGCGPRWSDLCHGPFPFLQIFRVSANLSLLFLYSSAMRGPSALLSHD